MDTNQVILVTGCSTGVGASVAVLAAKAGHRVYASMRNLEKKAALLKALDEAGVTATLVKLDVCNAEAVVKVVDQIIATEGRLDCVVANAGIGYVRTTEHATEAEIQAVMDTNYMGVVRCVKAALPSMRERGNGRFIAVSSVGGLVGQPFNEFYCASKFALEGYFESLATYVTPAFGVHFTLVEPGGIQSEFVNSILQQVAATGGFAEDAYKPILDRYIGGRGGSDTGDMYQTSDQVAEVVMQCVQAETPPVRTRTSNWSESFTSLKTASDPQGLKLRDQVFNGMIGDLNEDA